MADDSKSPFSEEQLESIKPYFSNIVNGAIRARDQMSDKKRAEDKAALEASFKKMLDDTVAALKGQHEEGDGDKGEGKGDIKGKRKADEVAIATMTRRMEDLSKQVEEANRRAQAERAKNRESTLRSKVGELLGNYGIAGHNFTGAYAHLMYNNRVGWEDDEGDRLVYHDPGDAVTYDLAQGLQGWLKTDEAKLYLPPTGAKGSGSRPGGLGPANGKLSEEEQKRRIWDALAREIT